MAQPAIAQITHSLIKVPEVPITHCLNKVHIKTLLHMPCFAMQTEDVGGVQGVAQEMVIALKGEAYAIDVAVKYPDPATALLDYGLMKATQTAAKSITLVNSGKYAVAFAFHQRGAMMKELFSIAPAEGSLAPGAQQAVELTFNRCVMVPHAPCPGLCITLSG